MSGGPTQIIADSCKVIEVTEGGKRHKVKLCIWDAAGDAGLHNLAHLFVRDIQVGVLVYSINSQISF